ncbi:MAG: DUF4058 family protein [Isosphaeraceae bacterium]
MPSTFPGMDPFLEDQGYWRELHTLFLGWTQDALAERVPDAYEVRIEERLSLVYEPEVDTKRGTLPDVAILRLPRPSRAGTPTSGTMTLEPVALALPRSGVEEVSEARLEIRRLSDRELVTAIELLSPSNKEAPGEPLYSQKRLELIHQPVHLVELDLLIRGKRLVMEDELPEGHYYAFVSRAERRFLPDTFHWTIRDPLPTIPIPLQAPDSDIPLDLAAIFQTIYQRARYERSINYKAPLGLPLDPEDREWAEAIAREFDPRRTR